MDSYDILVIGELNVDLILTGEDLTPGFGQAEKLVDDATLALGSSSAIFACGASRLGLRVGFIGKVGDDSFGRFLLQTLEERGVDTGPVLVDPAVKTGLTLHLSRPHDRAMLTYLGSIAALKPDEVDRSLFERARHIHLGSFFLQKGIQKDLPSLFAAARQAGATVSLDPGWDPDERWNGALQGTLEQVDVFMPNEQELLAISDTTELRDGLERMAAQIPTVVVKLGKRGAAARQGDREQHCQGFRVEAIDTTGAGDSFNTGFLYGLLNGMELVRSLRWGCACGALSTTGVGGIDAQPTPQQVRELLDSV